MGDLILVRHGHTALNSPGTGEGLRAWLDIPLDQNGLDEAAGIAERLAAYPLECIYCSDLRRARQTAEVVGKRKQVPVVATLELRPWNLGMFAGHRVRDVLPFLNLLNQRPDLAAPCGESFYQFYGRYSSRLLAMLNAAERSQKHIVAVTHVRNLLATVTIVNGGSRDMVPVCGGPATGTFTIVRKEGGLWTLRSGPGGQRGDESMLAIHSSTGSLKQNAVQPMTLVS